MSAVRTDTRQPAEAQRTAYTVTLLQPDGLLHDYPINAATLLDLADVIQAIFYALTREHVGVTLDRHGRVFIRRGWNPSAHTGAYMVQATR